MLPHATGSLEELQYFFKSLEQEKDFWLQIAKFGRWGNWRVLAFVATSNYLEAGSS